MKHITNTTALAGVALLALTACGGDAEPDASSAPERSTEQAQDPQEEEVEQESAVEDPEPIDNEGLAPKDMDFSDDPILADREFTGRMTGDVVASVGEPVEIDEGAFEGIGNFMGTVTLDELVAGPECYTTTDETIKPYNGYFLFATFTISADADADGSFDLNDNAFRWLGLDEHVTSYETFQCMEALNGRLDSLRPGDSAERVFVFDIPEFEGTLSYEGATNYVDWEIERSDYDNAENLPAE